MTDVQKIFDADPRIVAVRIYEDGWVPNAYKWPAPGHAVEFSRDGNFKALTYDRKRPHARGPNWVARSAKGGTLMTG